MAQPVRYSREHSFAQDELGRQDGSALDNELDKVTTTLDQIRHNLAAILADDEELRAGIVDFESLSDDAKDGIVQMFLELSKEFQVLTEHLTQIDRLYQAIEYISGVYYSVDNVDKVASSSAKVVTVANDILKVVTVANHIANVDNVANALPELRDILTRTAENAAQARAWAQSAAEQKDVVISEGNTQVERVRAAADWALIGYGLGCNEEVWTTEENIAEGSVITLPRDMRYVVGHNHLRLSWNGCVLMKPANFEEIGEADSASTTFKIKFPIEAGDELMAWTVPLGRGEDVANVLEQISDLSDAVSDISEHAVYHDMEG